ncbi:hypothetical protein ACFVQ0_06000 [Streptomyces sp. NPDC057900]|uniref:hypothetical protein n=1 Tax=Streptomyces sp. NPDC057900 TaxID=3346274 RepID=UPI0036EBFB90
MNPRTALLGVLTGGAVTALVQGAVDGPRWLLLIGLNATVTALVLVDLVSRVSRAGIAPGPRAGRPRSFAPAVVHGVRAFNRATGRASGDPASPETAFEFDITVMPEDGKPFRVRLRHPLDVQDARGRRSMVVEYDPGEPWRVSVPTHPPTEWVRRARQLDPAGPPGPRLEPRRPGAWVPAIGAVTAVVLLGLIRLTG